MKILHPDQEVPWGENHWTITCSVSLSPPDFFIKSWLESEYWDKCLFWPSKNILYVFSRYCFFASILHVIFAFWIQTKMDRIPNLLYCHLILAQGIIIPVLANTIMTYIKHPCSSSVREVVLHSCEMIRSWDHRVF